jgi:hypothetical protein
MTACPVRGTTAGHEIHLLVLHGFCYLRAEPIFFAVHIFVAGFFQGSPYGAAARTA